LTLCKLRYGGRESSILLLLEAIVMTLCKLRYGGRESRILLFLEVNVNLPLRGLIFSHGIGLG
jgi:hypothetical protein